MDKKNEAVGRRVTMRALLGFAAIGLCGRTVIAGMPGAFPEDIRTYLRLSESADQRFQAISFFVVGVILATIVVKFLWNSIATDSGWLPSLSWSKTVAVVVLWGSLFVLVLTMISGARELMTPGAWKKEGITYTLEDDR